MKMADILRNLADKLEQIESNGAEGENQDRPANSGKTADEFQNTVNDGAASGDQDASIGTMMPPLQQKLEILKKATGMENAFDNQGDELADIKKLTGIKAVIQQEASSDNDITG